MLYVVNGVKKPITLVPRSYFSQVSTSMFVQLQLGPEYSGTTGK